MIKKIQAIYHNLFPTRQLLIRQHGEVNYVSFSPRLQFTLVLAIAVSCTWMAFSSVEYFTLNQKVSLTKNKLELSQNSLVKLSRAYREKHSDLAQQLDQVEQQQKILQNILDSMPPATTEKSTQVIQTDITNSKSTQAQPKIKTEKSPLEPELIGMTKHTHSTLTHMDNLATKLEHIVQYQTDNRIKLEQQIEQRYQLLTQAIFVAGISPNKIIDNVTSHAQAQGGPLNDLTMTSMTTENKSVLNKLMSLLKLESALSNLPVSFPAKKYYISSYFGIRNDPLLKRPAMHKGIDMAGWKGTKIFTPANGIVRRAGHNGSYGLFIEIDHQNGFLTRYGHLSKIKVHKGQALTKDDLIGLMGSSGRSTSTHLHYEILFENKQINPLKLIKALKDVH